MPHPFKRKRILATAGATLAVMMVGALSAGAQPPTGSPLVGRWARTTTCQEYVTALRNAGLGAVAPAMLAGNGLVAGTPEQLARKTAICQGATPRLHSHFFNARGRFGSVDWKGKQVDDGPYRIIDDRTIRIGDAGAAFRYRMIGKRLTLQPVISAAAKREALARPLEFSVAGWMVNVALAPHSWAPVPCKRWC
jgi:hypothetical protein